MIMMIMVANIDWFLDTHYITEMRENSKFGNVVYFSCFSAIFKIASARTSALSTLEKAFA